MKLFLDSADPAEIKRYSAWGILDGITTTPTFFRRLGAKNGHDAIADIATQFGGEIHIEALGHDADEVVKEARRNREHGANVVSKIPIGAAGLEATRRLHQEGIRVNVHLVFTVNQAVLAAKAGAAYVCPLMGRMTDAGLPAEATVAKMVRTLAQHPDLDTQVMASSIRNPRLAEAAFSTGAAAVTIPGGVLGEMLQSPLTDRALGILIQDTARTSTVAERMRPVDQLAMVKPNVPLSQALVEMTRTGMGLAAVVADGAVCGVLTDGDARRSLIKNDGDSAIPVHAIMSPEPKRVGPKETVDRAVEQMRTHRVSEILVADRENRPLGLLSLHDLMLDVAK